MRRKLLLLLPLMGLCLLVIADRAPVALSIPPADSSNYIDDGSLLPSEDAMAILAKEHPSQFLEACLNRYNREIRGYGGELRKQERIDGKLNALEVIDFWFREEPYSVLMKWKEGVRLAKGSLFVEGENDGKAVVRSKFANIVVDQDPEGRMARQSARYTMKEFSIRQAMERTLHAWKAAYERGTLSVEYKGLQPVAELADRKCYVLKRTCNPPEEDGLVTIEIAVDAETWLQTGSTLMDGQANLIGKYLFPVLHINPEFPADTFTKPNLKK
jgi:hypothetical protein